MAPRRSKRKLELQEAAAGLFRERGFHNVSMDDIAAAVGLTGPALYRHFRNKHEVLAQALNDQLALVEGVLEGVIDEADGERRFERFLEDLGNLVLDDHEVLLWKRERRHLTGDERAAVRERVRTMRIQTVEILRGRRPELSESDAELLAWVLLSIYSNTGDYRKRVGRGTASQALGRMARAVVSVDLASAPAGTRVVGPEHLPVPAGRRERVLVTATRLFHARGYFDVSVEDIADASQTAIATVYQLFSSKVELLEAILLRGAEGTRFVAEHRLAIANGDEPAIETIANTHVELSCGPHGALFSILATDLLYLPEEARRAVGRSTREYVEEWIDALSSERPELTSGELQALTRSVIGFVGETSQVTAMRQRPNLEGELRLLALTVLHS
jgi:AcrR family transcriptional regulator